MVPALSGSHEAHTYEILSGNEKALLTTLVAAGSQDAKRAALEHIVGDSLSKRLALVLDHRVRPLPARPALRHHAHSSLNDTDGYVQARQFPVRCGRVAVTAPPGRHGPAKYEIGRASCRERES